MASSTAAEIIARLELRPHPEGGYYRETFRDKRVDANGRAHSTAIYFLLARGDRSHWHRVDAVEVWHYYAGAPLTLQIAHEGCTPHDGEARPRSRRGRAAAGASCRRTPGNARRPPATGRWSAAPSRRDSSSQASRLAPKGLEPAT